MGPLRPEFPAAGELHVWSVALDLAPDRLRALGRCLSEPERARSARFHFPRLRERYIAGRGALRMLLGRYLEVSPERLRFRYEARGKPALLYPDPVPALEFNLSHSNGLALLALGTGVAVGVDVERVRSSDDLPAVARRFFSPAEVAELLRVPHDFRAEAFFRCWTRKEAIIKTSGEGLSRPLHSFDVTLDADGPARLLRLEGEPDAPSRWTLRGLLPATGFVGAVAVGAPIAAVKEWRAA